MSKMAFSGHHYILPLWQEAAVQCKNSVLLASNGMCRSMVCSFSDSFLELCDEVLLLLVRHPHRGAVADAPLGAPQAVLVLDLPLVPGNNDKFSPKRGSSQERGTKVIT